MLNIITYDVTNADEYMEIMRPGCVILGGKQEIEERFQWLFNEMLWEEDEGLWDGERPSFDSPVDLALMKEIDHADRVSLLVVKTEIGTAPLTCLCTGGKFGLLVNYYTKRGSKIIAHFGVAGDNVWDFIGREMDATIYMDRRSLMNYSIPYQADTKNILIDGMELREYVLDRHAEDALCTVTSSRLKTVNEHYLNRNEKDFLHIPLCKTMEFKEIYKQIRGEEYEFVECPCWDDEELEREIERYDFFREMVFNIRTMEIRRKTMFKYPAIWVLRKIGDAYDWAAQSIYKYPDFIECVEEVVSIYKEDTQAEEIFMVVFDNTGDLVADRGYMKEIDYGLVYNPKENVMDVINVWETLKKLDAIADSTEIQERKNKR